VEAPRPEVSRLPVALPSRPAPLAGREDLLRRLDGLLTSGEGPRTVVLSGLGGVGKTTVAVEYAHWHLAEVGIAWLVPAEGPALLAAGLGELAVQAGARSAADSRDPVASVHAVLAAYPAEWLLIFDNAPDEAQVGRFLPPAGRGRVLINSQSQHWPGRHVLDVPVLDATAAAGYLISRTGDPDTEAAAALADELGGLPLALEQAAGYIQAAGLNLEGYLSLYRERRASLLARGSTSRHPDSVTTTLGLALSRLDDQAPAGAGLLRLMACLAPEPVPLGLLLPAGADLAGVDAAIAAALGPVAADPLAAADAVAALRQYSLATPAGHGMILVHRLVQAVTLDQMPAPAADAWKGAAGLLVQAAIPDNPRQPGNWPACAALLPHAQAALAADSHGMEQMTIYLTSRRNYEAAAGLQRARAAALEHSRGTDDPAALRARAELAALTALTGDPAAASSILTPLLPALERILGPDDDATLSARHNAAASILMAGDTTGALAQFEIVLRIRERVLGPEHPSTLTTRAVIADVTGEFAHDPATARDMYATLLPAFERSYGPDDTSTLLARARLARWTGGAGDPAAARDILAALLPDRERISGAGYPDTLDVRASLARWTEEAGDPAAARDMLSAAMPLFDDTLGTDHPDTQAARRHLKRLQDPD